MSPDQQAHRNMRGILYMLGAMSFFIIGDSLTKAVGARLPVGEVIFLRSAAATILLTPLVLRSGSLGMLRQAYSLPMLIRNIGEVSGSLLFVTSLVRVPIANATAIMQTTPLVITAVAGLFLGDRVGWRRWTATAVGFLGALLIIRPTSPDFTWWYLPAILAVFSVTMRDLGTRYIDKSVPTLLITFLTFVLTGLGGALLGLTESWQMPSAADTAKLMATGVVHTIGASLLVTSLRSGGEIATIIPFRYIIVVWSILIGYLFWGELPHPTSILGIAIVVGAGLYTVHREQKRRRQAAS
jgi:drug/metabolite transporter (DMT)-like permease